MQQVIQYVSLRKNKAKKMYTLESLNLPSHLTLTTWSAKLNLVLLSLQKSDNHIHHYLQKISKSLITI